ncbi:ATP-binding protein [Streptomyces sp. NBC_01497]|uniref:ATP-binding protein n=1 Tax=Streptomyces sp. NBC_01497 TaxID=2903885 RepID=UPI002E370625|nr:ATP-binding protein [Streptomyces sp. NBC_01497]
MTATTETRPTGCPGYSETLPCAPESARIARNLVHTALTVWGHEDLAQDGTSIVSELVANAAQHTRSRLIEVSITHPAPAYVRIAVADRDRGGLPLKCATGEGDESGRGLALVDALAERWGTDILPRGKRVWGELKCEAAS